MSDESARRAAWIAEQIRKKMHHPAVVMGGLSEVLGALALYVEDAEARIAELERVAHSPQDVTDKLRELERALYSHFHVASSGKSCS